jgi:hypothetical protein
LLLIPQRLAQPENIYQEKLSSPYKHLPTNLSSPANTLSSQGRNLLQKETQEAMFRLEDTELTKR